MSLFDSFNISASGLTAQRLRMDIISNNIANVNTTRTPEGGPYKRQMPVFAERKPKFVLPKASDDIRSRIGQGVKVVGIKKDTSPPKLVYNPEHPDANEDGYVAMPNIDLVSEMVDMIEATRAYEANVTALNSTKNMAMKALEIGRG
ncbi:flagellar basal body rod protein FlgC [Anoxybacter fermentans]|uniref:Flagellar basal-body rod protein FlgC n=1 Tax=Anoxybacter fermentans TaxID=1323375 RepID=A0A3S9SZV0_9FIRM|nr:flagellar basal body rod protein FlgC [Anoxybacter fermentans]AZR73883.1 flagellar basal body rod protein FlgC [Anoxybacter fermentans]